jgi:outer membrane receptor protein involved in Fe transport
MFLAGTCVACVGVPAAAAQNTPQGPTPQQQQAATGQDQTNQQNIVITATKRPQVLLDVPQSVSVVSGGTLEAQHANTIQDYLKLVPGLQLDQSRPGEGRLILRGVNTGGVASTVSVYVDETPFGSSSGLVNGGVLAGDFDTFDLNRIEVLRGPQGTLYGASSLSGVLRFVTNAPSTSGFEARARAGIEGVSDGALGYNADAVLNVPLGSAVAVRVSGNYRKDGGFIDSIGTGGSQVTQNINSDRSYGGRASVLFRPSNAVSIRLSAIAQNIDANAPSIIEADPVTLRPLHGLSQSEFVPQFSNLHYRIYNGTGTFDLGFANLTSSTSYETQKQHERIDFSFALTPAFGAPIIEPQDTNLKKFTQELRLSSQTRLVDWLVGAYYTHEDGFIAQQLLGVQPFTGVPLPGFLLVTATVNSKYQESAGFADATIHFAPKFDLEVGGRYSHNKQSVLQVTSGPLGGGALPKIRSSENVFTYSIAPKYKPNENTTFYARVAKGFRPGGPNVVPPGAPSSVQTFHSDSIVSYEAGAKAETSNHRFSIDAAAFHIDWKNIQLFTSVSGFGINANGSSAKSDGFEFTAAAHPVPGLELSLNGAYTNARLSAATPPDVGGRKGDQLPFTPKLSVGLNGDYHWQMAPTTRAHVGASFRHLSGQTGGFDPDFVAAFGRQRHVRPYDVIDVYAGLEFGRFDLEAYVKNLGNSHGVTSLTGLTVFGPPGHPDQGLPVFPGGAIGTGIIRPRTVGVTLGFNY